MTTQDKPNVVFIFADDWGWGDLGCYGHPHVKTPHLDQLAAEGTLFSQFYVCSGVCSPSRAAVLTGQFPARHGIHGHFADDAFNARRGMPNWLDPAVPTYTRCLRQAGYAVGHFGKWHLGHSVDAPTVTAYGIDECRVNVGNGPHFDFPPAYQTTEDRLQAKVPRCRSSEIIVDESIAFIERHQDEPFLLNVWLNDTHATLDPDEKQLEPWRRFSPWGLGDKHVGALAIYYAVVAEADRQIGRLLQRLDAQGLRENTLVIFSADNGPEDISIPNATHSGVGSAGPFRGRKRSLYEGGIRVPFILRWPGRTTAGAVDDTTPLSAVDLFPTFCRIAGAPVPPNHALDGEDMADVFQGAQRPRKTPLFWEWRFSVHSHCLHKSPLLAVREGEWKLLFNPDRSRVELYCVPNDPMELNNLADRNPEIVDALASRALAWQQTLPPGPIDVGAGSNAYPWPKSQQQGAST